MVADTDRTVTSVIDADIPATQKIEALGTVAAKAAGSVEDLGEVLADTESKAAKTAGLKAQAEAHKQVGAAAEEAARKTRTSSQAMQESIAKAEAQASRATVNNRSGFVPSNMDKVLSASLPAYAEFIKLQQLSSRLDRAETLSSEQKARALERLYAQYETGAEVMRRAGMERAAIDKLDDATAKKALAAAEALDAEAKAAERAAVAHKSMSGNFGPSAEYLGQSRLASLSPDYAKDQRLQALTQERVATEKALADAIASGAIPAAKASEVQKQLAEHYTKAEEKAAKMNGTIHLSNNAYLQLTASARNTFDSLAAGLPISQIMITQGAQVVSALASEGSVLKSLTGPTGLATAAFISFAAAMSVVLARAVSLSSQMKELRATAIAYNSFAISASDAAETARRMADNSSFSRRETTDVVKGLASDRMLSGTARAGVEAIAPDLATATGKSLADVAKELTAGFDGTYESVRKLDEAYGFLDSTQLSMIRSMLKAGDVSGGLSMAIQKLAVQAKEASEAAKGAGADGFEAMARSWNKAVDSMANSPSMKLLMQFLEIAGRGIESTFSNKEAQGPYADAQKRLAAAERRMSQLTSLPAGMTGTRGGFDDASIATAQRELDSARAAMAEQVRAAIAEANKAVFPSMQEFQRGVDFDKKIKEQNSAYESQLKVLRAVGVERARLEAIPAAEERGQKLGFEGKMLEEFVTGETRNATAAATVDLERQTAATNRQVLAEKELAEASLLGARAMSEARAAAAGREAAANGGNASAARAAVLAEDEQRALRGLNSELNKLGDEQHLVNRAKEAGIEVATIELRLKQAGLENTDNEARGRARLTEIVRMESTEKERLAKIERDAIAQQTALLSAQNDNVSDSEREYQRAAISANAAYAAGGDEKALADALALAELNRQQANARAGRELRMQMNPDDVRDQQIANLNAMTGISPKDYAAQMEVIRRTYEDNTIARLELENDFASGAERAMRRYIQSAGTTADQVERVMTNAFKGMEDALVEFAMTGKLNFTDLANSIIRDMIRMQVQASITAPLSGIMGSMGASIIGSLFGTSNAYMSGDNAMGSIGDGGLGTGDMGTSFDAPMTFSAKGNIFANDNVVPFARGGTFTNSVVSQPTLFKFAQGAQLGEMGEAGPEAIVPLTRGPDGNLGVRSFGGGGSTPADKVQVAVEVNNYGSDKDFSVEQDYSGLIPVIRIIASDESAKAVQAFSERGLSSAMRPFGVSKQAVKRG